jgi:hypothetical protein
MTISYLAAAVGDPHLLSVCEYKGVHLTTARAFPDLLLESLT